MSDDEKIVWESVSVTPEEVKKILDEREGGRYAGQGDSPWTQEFYEEVYGINFEKRDWILSGILKTESYYGGFGWYLDCARRHMAPLIGRYSLAHEMMVKAEEIRLCMRMFGEGFPVHMNRLHSVMEKAMEDGMDSKYPKEPLSEDDLDISSEERGRLRRRAGRRFSGRLGRLLGYGDDDDEDSTERGMARGLAFDAAYICLRCEDPGKAYSLFLKEMQNEDPSAIPMVVA